MAGAPEPPWRRRQGEAPRAERRPLTRDAIVDAALGLLDRQGLAGLSMRRLAQELGVGAASLYWHVRDKEELLGLLLDRIVGESEVPEPDPDNWQEQIKQVGRETGGCCCGTATRPRSRSGASRPGRSRCPCSSATSRSSSPPASRRG